jgi:hypothetical protein
MPRSSFTRCIRPGVSFPLLQHRGAEVARQRTQLVGRQVHLLYLRLCRLRAHEKVGAVQAQVAAERGLEQCPRELNLPRRRSLKLGRVDQPEVLQRRLEVEPGFAQRTQSHRTRGRELLLLAGEQIQPTDQETVALQPSVQLAPLVGDADSGQLNRTARQVDRAGRLGGVDAPTDSGIGPQEPVESSSGLRWKQRLEHGQVEAVGLDGERYGIGLALLHSNAGCRVLWRECQSIRQGAFDGEGAAVSRGRGGGYAQLVPGPVQIGADGAEPAPAFGHDGELHLALHLRRCRAPDET